MLNLQDYLLNAKPGVNHRRDMIRMKVFYGLMAFYYAALDYRMNLAKERLEHKPDWKDLERMKDNMSEDGIEVKTEDLAIPESKIIDMMIAVGQDRKQIQRLILQFSNIEVFDAVKDSVLEQGIIEEFGYFASDAIENSALAIMTMMGNMKLKKFRKAYGFKTLDGRRVSEEETREVTRYFMKNIVRIGGDVLDNLHAYTDNIYDALMEILQNGDVDDLVQMVFGCSPQELSDDEDKLAGLCMFVGKVTGVFNDWFELHPEEAPDDEDEDEDETDFNFDEEDERGNFRGV